MIFSISYASRRSEIWQHYWRTWRHRLWPIHLVVFVLAATAASLARHQGRAPPDLLSALIVAAFGLIPILLLVLFPMLMFKPQRRLMEIDEFGIQTVIGSRQGFVPWIDVAEVRDTGTQIIIMRTTMNAFVIPARAFGDAAHRRQFLDFVTRCTDGANLDLPEPA
jgi:hypothetical protein